MRPIRGLAARSLRPIRDAWVRSIRFDPAYYPGVAGEISHTDLKHLWRAVELAEAGRGRVSPNPMVGAVIARPEDGRVIGEGYHGAHGGPHAEQAALDDCTQRGENPAGATAYVSLEPCAHIGRRPACSGLLVDAGIARVVIASEDPTPKASGRGPEQLRAAGIRVDCIAGPSSDGPGHLDGPTDDETAVREAAELLNQPFRKRAFSGYPWIVLKLATSLDGRVALPNGESRWITSSESRALGHRWRSELDAVAVGSGTVAADDPQLTVRNDDRVDPAAPQPRRVVFDTRCRTSPQSRLVATIAVAPLTVVTGPAAPTDRKALLLEAGVDVCEVGEAPSRGGLDPRLDLEQVLKALAERDISSMLVEGGPTLAGAFVASDHVDEWRQFIAPIVLGDGKPALQMTAPEAVEDAFFLPDPGIRQVGGDFLVSARVKRW